MKRVKMTAIGVGMLTSSAAWGAVAYNNFGAGDAYNVSTSHYAVQGPTVDFGALTMWHAQQFVSGATGTAETFKFAISNYEGDPQAIVRLYSDSGTDTLGTQIGDEVTFAVLSAFFNPSVSSIDVSGAGWELVSGQKYWLGLRAGPASVQVWHYNTTSDVGLTYLSAFGGQYSPLPLGVFSLEVVPAPASAVLLGFGGLVAARRRR